MKTMNNELLFKSIKKSVTKINKKLLTLNNTGVFFAPELYIAFCIGKEIYKNREEIFGRKEVEWVREVAPKRGSGPVDILFKDGNVFLCGIELKVRSVREEYVADVRKLSKLTNIQHRYFCALSDYFIVDEKDKRIEDLKKDCENEIELLEEFRFETWKINFKKKLGCNLVLFSIK
jgi:hypothetical protein